MEINVQGIIDEVRSLLQTAYADKWATVKSIAEGYIDATETRLKALANNLSTGEITPEFAAERLKEEPAILKSELTSFAVVTGAAAEALTNGVLSIFQNTIKEITEP